MREEQCSNENRQEKNIHSEEQAGFASRQLDDTHRVKVGRGTEAASLLREEHRGGVGGAYQLSHSEYQNSLMPP